MRAAREFNAKLFLPKFKIGTHTGLSQCQLFFQKIIFSQEYTRRKR
jgi:hypothetical protein